MASNHIEIERKFLVRKDLWYAVHKPEGEILQQGYLVTEPGKTVRVRVSPSSGFLTIKGPSENASRDEFEYRIPREDALALLDKFVTRRVDKVRYTIVFKDKTWEIDEFYGASEGLIVAEIELDDPRESFEKPAWIGEEVTDDPRYSNAYLAGHPYGEW